MIQVQNSAVEPSVSILMSRPRLTVTFIVPSYPSATCGIATYSTYLLNELGRHANVNIIGAADFSDRLYFLRSVASLVSTSDIVHVQHTFALYGHHGWFTFPFYSALKKARRPIVTTIHELPPTVPQSSRARVIQPYLRACIRTIATGSSAVVLHTQAALDLFTGWNLQSNVYLIPHGTVQTALKPHPADPGDRPLTIGFFGFIAEHKGVHRVIDALAELPHVHFQIAGISKTAADKQYEDQLRQQAERLGVSDRVHFLGFVPDKEMARFFQSVDVVVFPYSQCTTSGALSLALAHNCVALTSNLPVFLELKDRYDCVEVFDLDDPQSLITQLRKVLLNERCRSALVLGSQKLNAETSWSRVAEQTHDLYEQLAER